MTLISVSATVETVWVNTGQPPIAIAPRPHGPRIFNTKNINTKIHWL
jgi:hypothetical protein